MSPLVLALRQALSTASNDWRSAWTLCGCTQSSCRAMTTGVVRGSTVRSRRSRSGLASATQPSVAWGARANWSGGVPCSQMPLPVLPRSWSTAVGGGGGGAVKVAQRGGVEAAGDEVHAQRGALVAFDHLLDTEFAHRGVVVGHQPQALGGVLEQVQARDRKS